MIKSATDKIRKIFEQPVNKAIDAAAGIFANKDQLSVDDMTLLAMVKAVLPADNEGMEKAFARIRNRLEKQSFSDRKISNLLDFLRKVAPGTPEKTVKVLEAGDPEKTKQFIENLLALSLEAEEYRSDALELTRQLALLAGYTQEEFVSQAEAIKITRDNRAKILRSGTGIVLALIVIGLFVLIATWLSSLLFGVVLAYIFLPLEQYFERRLSRKPGWISRLFCFLIPVKKLGRHLQRQNKFELSEEEQKRREQLALTTKSTTLTVSCVVCGFLALLLGIALLLGCYVKSFNNKSANTAAKSPVQNENVVAKKVDAGKNEPDKLPVTDVKTAAAKSTVESKPAAQVKLSWWGRTKNKIGAWWGRKGSQHPAEPEMQGTAKTAKTPTLARTVSDKLITVLDNLKVRFQKLPLIQGILTELSNYLADDKAEKQLTELVLKKSGGLFAFVTKFAAMFASFLLNILMTFFFFSLLLGKIAGFVNSRKNEESGIKDDRATSYLIRTVFNGRWLPKMSEENLREGDRIVGEVFNKLRIWLRGYMTMIAIDFCVYTTVFYLLDVPYAPILGAVAAVGILLPYIGPVSSALLTVLVTLAIGGAGVTVLQIGGIIGIYLLHNGIIEQFFIYPAIIGESLGLSTLETIIVVLLGGIIAGIPGMIFALPTASVIKYLVPQIYRCWR